MLESSKTWSKLEYQFHDKYFMMKMDKKLQRSLLKEKETLTKSAYFMHVMRASESDI